MADTINGWADATILGPMLTQGVKHIADVKTKAGIVPLYERPAPFHEFIARVGDRWFSVSMIASVSRLADAVAEQEAVSQGT